MVMELNPILRREIRARWRKWPAFAVVFGYATGVALAVGWALGTQAAAPAGGTALARLGHDTFVKLTWLETLGWMLLAPFLTATAIAGERESGTLALMQLSPLEPLRVIGGKLLSVLSFIALMLLVPLPAVAVCFMLGGVSPGELIAALVLHAVTATTGALIGLNCSAWSHRANEAVRATVTALVVLNLGCLYFSVLLRDLHPLVAAMDMFDSDQGLPLWIMNLVGQLLLSAFLFWNASCAMLQPLHRQASSVVARMETNRGGAAVAAASTMYIGDQAQFPYVRWYPLPLSTRWRFGNVVLQREARRRLSVRQESAYGEFDGVPATLLTAAFCYVPYVCIIWGVELLNPELRPVIWWVHSILGLACAGVAAATMGALSFVRDREARMLEPLMLSALSPAEVIWGKLVAPLLTCGYYALPLLPILLPCLGGAHGIAPWQGVTTLLLALATAWCGASLGLLVSWFCRTTLVALPATVLTILAVAIGVVLLTQPDPQILAQSVAGIAALLMCGCLALLALAYAMRHGVREPDRRVRLAAE